MPIDYPFIFVNDTDADADEVNANFSAVSNAFDSLSQVVTNHLSATNPHSITPQLIDAETPSGAQAKADAAAQAVKDYVDEFVSNVPTAEQKAALAGTSGDPSSSNKYVTDSDPRLTEPRTPTAHKSTHAIGGSDPLTPDDIGAETPDGALAKVNSAVNSLKDYVDSRLDIWFEPSDDVLTSDISEKSSEAPSEVSTDVWVPVCAFFVPYPGRYRITGEFRGEDYVWYIGEEEHTTGLRAGVRICAVTGIPAAPPVENEEGIPWSDTGWQGFQIDMDVPTYTGLVIVEALRSYDEDQDDDGTTRLTGKTTVRQVTLRGSQTVRPSQSFTPISYLSMGAFVRLKTDKD